MAPSILADNIKISHFLLQTPDIERAIAFYTGVLGMKRQDFEGRGDVALSASPDAEPLIVLHENRNAVVRREAVPCLYHFALLLPTRADLGLAIRILADAGWRIDGASDISSVRPLICPIPTATVSNCIAIVRATNGFGRKTTS